MAPIAGRASAQAREEPEGQGPGPASSKDGPEEKGHEGAIDGVREDGVEEDGRERGGAEDSRWGHCGDEARDGLVDDGGLGHPVRHQGAEAAEAQTRKGLVANRPVEDENGETGVLPLWRGRLARALSEEGGDHVRAGAGKKG